MFAAETPGQFEPNKVRRKIKPSTNGASENGVATKAPGEEDDGEYEEDFLSEDGAVWPIKAGQVVDWPCFFALMSYIYNTINPPFHTPILLIAEPVWTPKELERITQFFFEKFKIPAFAILDSAIAISYGYGLENATIIDVGQDKADVSAIAGFLLHTTGRSTALPDCGGEAMTLRLQELLESKKFTHDMCEQLKKSNICEILPPDVELPSATSTTNDKGSHGNPAAAASTGGNEPTSTATVGATRAAGEEAGVLNDKGTDDENEGVLDIASIVTGGKMNEFLESKEKEKAEKAEKAAAKRKGDAAAAASKVQRLPNSKRYKNTFVYDDKALHNALKDANASGSQMAELQAAMDGATKKSTGETDQASGPMKREIEVGIERFQAASGGVIDRLADAVFRTVSSVEEVDRRSELWNSVVIAGNGSKVRGFKEALLSRLQSKYQISPSSATIFTSELPSNMSTPFATGMNSPQAGGMGAMNMHPPGVNPLLYAATTAQNPHLNPMGQSMYGTSDHRHSSHGQTPTSIKLAKIPEYFPEWKDAGYEEASFLGAQVAAKVLFTVDTGPSKAYMTRSDYNEQGPQGIHEYGL